jgi:alpha-L-fucosidase
MKPLTLFRQSIAIFLLANSLFVHAQEKYFPDPDPLIQQRLEEWRDLKFGLLMHWGTYSQWGIVESWSICPEDVGWAAWARKKGIADNYEDYRRSYENLRKTFNPTKFDPDKWAAAAKDAGMKYVIFTTKHHDGFNMFDTKFSEYKITSPDVPFSSHPRKDVTKEIFNAFRAQGLWAGAYFSKPDWHSDSYWWKHFPPADRNPNYSIAKYPERWNQFKEFTHNQIDELVSNYGKIDILWLDGGWVRKKTDDEIKNELMDVYEGSRWVRNAQSQDIDMAGLVTKIRKKQPHLLVVDRAVPGEQQNYLTPEQHIPDMGLPYPWETCMTMANSWSYVPNDVYKPANDLVEKLVDIVSKGGNYLLNIGPSPEGELDSAAYNRLAQIGSWIKINGEAIYGTRMFASYSEGDKIRFTQNKAGNVRYIFLFDFPQKSIEITKMKFDSKTSVHLLGDGKPLKWKKTINGVSISVPEAARKKSKYVWVLKVQ